MKKECGLSSEELTSAVGFLGGLEVNDQITLARIISDNNEAIKEYIDSKTSPENTTKQVAGRLRDEMQRRGMR